MEYGAPTSAIYLCSRADLIHRNSYDNHASIGAHGLAVLAKVVSGAVNHFLLVFPWWIWRFIYGMFLSPIGFLLRKGKGWIVVDSSTHIQNADNTGALYNQMERTYPERIPRTYYAPVQQRH